MRKRVLLSLMLVLALLATTGCNLIVKDEAVDRATPIVEVAGRTYTKGEINDEVAYMLDYYTQMYTSYGMAFDATDAQNIADLRSSVIDSCITEAVIREKIAAGGHDQLTEEELAEVEATVEEDYQLYYDTVEMFNFSNTELEGEELTAAIEAEMANMGYPTREALLENEMLMAAQDKLRAEVVKDVSVTDEEIAAEYQLRVDEAKAAYEADPAAYGSDASNDADIYYTPAGWRNVKHVLISYSDEDQDAISALESDLAAKQAEHTEENDLSAEIADLTAQLDAAKAAANAAIQPTVDEVAAKIAEGADFDALITEYNTDPGMTADSVGYPVSEASTNWVDEFKAASMALANVGDVSAAVPSGYGVHFIKYVGDIAEGPIALDEVKDEIAEELLTTKQDELYSATVDQWVIDADAKVYMDRLD